MCTCVRDRETVTWVVLGVELQALEAEGVSAAARRRAQDVIAARDLRDGLAALGTLLCVGLLAEPLQRRVRRRARLARVDLRNFGISRQCCYVWLPVVINLIVKPT